MDRILNILVAEDDRDDAWILQRAFNHSGITRPIHIVHDGKEAIEYLSGNGPYADRSLHPYPDVLILDLKMPKVSGFEVLQWINEHPDYRVIPCIVWSSSADRRDVKHAFCLGAHGYLCKPARYEDFVPMVEKLLGFWNCSERPGIEPFEPTCETMKDQHPFFGAHVR